MTLRLLRPFFAHQRPAFDFAMATPDPFLAMAMRTGKTLVAIRSLRARYPLGKFLVVAPLTVLIPWEAELRKEGLPPVAMAVDEKAEILSVKWFGPQPGFYLVGPAALRVNSRLLEWPWDAIAVDESTLMKNPKAEITRELNSANVRATTRMCLSGWPCPEGEEDWFEQMRFVGHGVFMGCSNFWQWRHRHMRLIGFDWVPKPGTRERIKRALRDKVYFLTAEQAGIYRKFVEENRVLPMKPAQEKIYRQVEEEFAAVWKDKSLSTKWVPVKELRLHQIASGEVPWDDGTSTLFDSKVKELLWLFGSELKRERRVVFFRFQRGVEEVARSLGERKVPCRSITGATSQDARRAAIEDYQSGRCRTLLLQADCGKFALDLSAGSVGIFYSLGHSFETWAQCRERFVHPRKRSANLLVYLVTKGTVEELIRPALRDKAVVGKFFFSRIYDQLMERRKLNGE